MVQAKKNFPEYKTRFQRKFRSFQPRQRTYLAKENLWMQSEIDLN
jgi:hypothetical protein